MAMKLMLSLELQAFQATIDAVDHDEIMPVCYYFQKKYHARMIIGSHHLFEVSKGLFVSLYPSYRISVFLQSWLPCL
jgi:hypothetical protein